MLEESAMPDHTIATRPAHPWVAAGQDTIRFGFGLLGPRADWALLRDRVQRAEALGFDSYWAQDHPIGGVDCWTNLAAMAAATTTIRLGSIVSCIYYRSPALLARIAADVDRLSHGRLILCLGIGVEPVEFAQLALPFPLVRERQHALEEAIRIVWGVWGDTSFTYQGDHFRV